MDQEIGQKLFDQTQKLWIKPEIEKRKQNGTLSSEFELIAAQVLFYPGQLPRIRLNSEVNAVLVIKPRKKFEKGENVRWEDIEKICDILLTDEEKDFGHITLIKIPNNHYIIQFRFIYDISKSKSFYDIGAEFLESAKLDIDSKRLRPAIESLSIASENFAKAILYQIPDERIRKTKKHGGIKERVNIYSQTGIIDVNYKDSFNRLLDARNGARYESQFEINKKEVDSLYNSVELTRIEIFNKLKRLLSNGISDKDE